MSKMKLNTEEESTIHPKANLLAQEIKFAKLLAGNDTDLATKKKQLNRLKIWLKNRANCSYRKCKILFFFLYLRIVNKGKP